MEDSFEPYRLGFCQIHVFLQLFSTKNSFLTKSCGNKEHGQFNKKRKKREVRTV
jgi:hypothetical protein